MAEVVLFGATGYTGRLVAEELGRRGIDFRIAGRNRASLEALAKHTGASSVHVAAVGDVDALVAALDGARVLITCVGPFMDLGDTAVEAALRARVHYLDSTGEGPFIARLLERDDEARAARIAIAPAFAFDEVPADVAATLAVGDLSDAELTITYAFPASGSNGSSGTIRTVARMLGERGPWLEDGRERVVAPGHSARWSPMPPPLGPKLAVAYPLAGEAWFAPRHLALRSCRTYVTAGAPQRLGLRLAPLLGPLLRSPPGKLVLDRLTGGSGAGPGATARAATRWMILAEATAGASWRNVALAGTDPYGLSARLLAAGAALMADDGFAARGVVSPVQAVGIEPLHKELIDAGATVETYEPRS